MPKDWSDDRERCRQSGIPKDLSHMPKTTLALEMLNRALDSGVTARWESGDVVYGDSFQLRWPLEERGQGYVIAVSRKAYAWGGGWNN